MLRRLLLIILLLPATAAGQAAATAGPDKKAAEDPTLVVVKFSWKRDRSYWSGRPPHSAVDDWPPAGAVSAGGLPSEASTEDQSGTMRQVEVKARRSGAYAVREFYRYKVTLRNTDARAVRAFYWSFETRQSLRPDDVARREFFCSAKIKPGKRREFEAQAPKAPSQTVSAEVAASDAGSPDQVVINRIEYKDGSVWQRPGWSHYPVTWRRVHECVELPSPTRGRPRPFRNLPSQRRWPTQ